MKKRLTLVFLVAITAMSLSAQPVVNGVMQGSPKTFMVDPATCNQANGWARAYNGSCPSQTSATTEGPSYTLGMASSWLSHLLMTNSSNTSSPTDNQACDNINPGFLLPIYPLAWNCWEYPVSSGLHYEDTVMRIGNTSGSSRSAKMEYSFIPDTINPVLLVAYECVLQAPTHTRVQNPSVLIQVSENNTNHNALLPLGYYPDDYITNGNNNPNPSPNPNWPYARYFYQAEGSDGPSVRPAEMTPSAFYSWFPTYECGAGYSKVVSTKYVILAFNLMEQARNHTPVKFKVLMRGCTLCGHYAYLYYTAKMVPGKITMDVSNHPDTVELSVPWGFNSNTYRWIHGLNKDTCVMMSSSMISNPYRVKIPRNQLMPYYRCEMESETGVPFVYEVRPHISDITADFSATQQDSAQMTVFQFNDLSQILEITPDFSAFGIYVPADTVVEPASSLRWSWKKEGSVWTSFAQDEHNPVLALPTPDHYDSIRVKLAVMDPETGARDSVEKTFYYGSNVGVDAYANEITLYPNPNSGKFVIQSSVAAMKEVCVYDLQGRLLRKVAADGQTTAIDIKGLPSGTYMVSIATDKGVVTKTVVKQ
ncbi:MAG: T9SS type A sorting domain-containing protein [Bacteroidales bacterium]|nr:T9SS type A sorting domain-containing protein [Bacteroidales bacterium]